MSINNNTAQGLILDIDGKGRELSRIETVGEHLWLSSVTKLPHQKLQDCKTVIGTAKLLFTRITETSEYGFIENM